MTDIGSVFPNENFTDTNPSDSPNMTEFRTAEECPEGYQLLNGECQAIIEEPGEETPPPGNELLPPEEVDGESEAGEQEETGEQEQEESSEQPQPQFG